MPASKYREQLKKAYSRLAQIRATRDTSVGGRKEVFATEAKAVAARINELKGKLARL